MGIRELHHTLIPFRAGPEASYVLRALREGSESMLIAQETETKHEGWSNFETWCVALWIDNDATAYHCWRKIARGARFMAVNSDGTPAQWLAQRLEDELSDYPEFSKSKASISSGRAGMLDDLMRAAFSEVNWHEIAEHLLAE